MRWILLILFASFFSSFASAQMFTLKVTDYGGLDNNELLKRVLDAYLEKIEDDVNELIPNADPERMMKNMSNASVIATKGVGSDYASDMNVFLVGATVGAGVAYERNDTINSDINGAGAATGMILGANADKLNVHNFAGLDTKKLNFYLNFMKLGQTQNLISNGGVDSDLRVGFLGGGLHFRYDWLDGSGTKMWGWGGVKLHWGYDFNQTEFTYENNLDRTVNLVDNGSGANIKGRITGRPKYQVKTTTHSIPLEISSDVRFLKVFSLYGGLGTDISYGKAVGTGKADGEVSPLVCTGGGTCGGGRILQVQVQANIEAEGNVAPLMARGFTGLQINLPYFNMFAQVNKGFGNNLWGATGGLKLVF
jgi:hypothetical protein